MDQVALDLGEPGLDFVQPGGVGGCEVQLEFRIGLEELGDLGSFVGREIVEDDVNFTLSLVARTSCSKKATNSWLVCRRTVLPKTSPVFVSKAA